MDLIATLSEQLGMDAGEAKALAGGLLGGLQQQVGEQVGAEEQAQLEAAVPELGDWKAQAAQLLGGSDSDAGGLGGLMSAASGLLGDSPSGGSLDLGLLTSLLTKLDLNPALVEKVVPILGSFLEDRLPPDLLRKVSAVAPLLGGSKGGVAGALGSLLGGG